MTGRRKAKGELKDRDNNRHVDVKIYIKSFCVNLSSLFVTRLFALIESSNGTKTPPNPQTHPQSSCIYSSYTCSSFGVTKSMGRCCGPSDCLESTPDPPAVIHPDPTGASRFVVKKCSRFNKDYVMYSKRVNESKKWLFLNQSQDTTTEKGGEKWVYELENYVREDPAFPKRGEILWRCALKYRRTRLKSEVRYSGKVSNC